MRNVFFNFSKANAGEKQNNNHRIKKQCRAVVSLNKAKSKTQKLNFCNLISFPLGGML